MLMMESVDLSMIAGETIRPMKRVEYESLTNQGYFEDEHVELLFGMVVQMPPIDEGHVKAVGRVMERLILALSGRAEVRIQAPYAASDWSEPEPDACVVPRNDDWKNHPDQAFLVVEVARSSLRRDRGPKARLYATANVDEYWIVDHVHERVEVFRDPHEGGWSTCTIHKRGEAISLLRFPDVSIAVNDVLPPQT